MTARARATIARARPNPTLSASYTGSAPQLHAIVDLPVDLPAFRRLRTRAAEAARGAAQFGLRATEVTVRYEVEAAYGRALAARERARLSVNTARDADSLVLLAGQQRDAGEASDLDVEVAMLSAGPLANAAAADALAAVGALLDLQLLMGLDAEHVTIALADSLTLLLADADGTAAPAPSADGRVRLATDSVTLGLPGAATTARAGERAAVRAVPLRVAAAEAALRAQELSLQLARRRGALVPSIQMGVEGRDPTGGTPGPFLVVGVALPLPLLNRYQGDVAAAAADRDRAQVELGAARRESAAVIARARLALTAARERFLRDRALVAAADVVTAKTLVAYREGASGIPAVLQAQRSARDVYAQFADDIVAAAEAAAAMRLALAVP
jgi:cobalt-zinc-cadmium efflux system outer membrane protein